MAVKGLHLNTGRSGGPTSREAAMGHQATPNPKKDLASWWNGFKNRKGTKKEEETKVVASPPPKSNIFGVPLLESIKYANVAISLPDEHGGTYVYGYVPIVVAKCGVFLKGKALDTEGIFRVSGLEKRIKELKTIFDTPDRYGRGLDWSGFTVHDAANVLRRYLRDLPEPIIPLEYYERFRDPLRQIEARSRREGEGMPLEISREDEEHAIKIYQHLITQLPPLNRQLLLYLLDLLAVFAAKSDVNLMNAANLAAIFQPGMLSHRVHDMSPAEYRLSQDVVIFLIDAQDHFLIGMSGTASDEKTKEEMTRAPATPQKQLPASSGVADSPLPRNVAPAAADVKRFGGLRRNASVSSKHSSAGPSIPGSPAPASRPASTFGSSGVHRSNTVPTKRSATGGTVKHRFSRSPAAQSPRSAVEPRALESAVDASQTVVSHDAVIDPIFSPQPLSSIESIHQDGIGVSQVSQGVQPSSASQGSTSALLPPQGQQHVPASMMHPASPPTQQTREGEAMHLNLEPPPTHVFGSSSSNRAQTPPGEKRTLSSFFSKSPTSDAERNERRETNKLRKKKKEMKENGGVAPSAQSSTSTIHLDGGRPPEENRLE